MHWRESERNNVPGRLILSLTSIHTRFGPEKYITESQNNLYEENHSDGSICVRDK